MLLFWFLRAVFIWVLWNQSQSDYSGQSREMYTAQWTNQNSKQIHVIDAKRRKTRDNSDNSCFDFVSHCQSFVRWESGASVDQLQGEV